MRRDRLKLVLIAGALVVTAGCATGEEWGTWKQHPTHFASGDHMFFSVRNSEGSAPRVKGQDIILASDEGWWGKPITISQEQILER